MRGARSGMKSQVIVHDSKHDWWNKCEPFTVRGSFTYLRPDRGNLKPILERNNVVRSPQPPRLDRARENSGKNGLMIVGPTFPDRGNAGI
jgi:hypothetical protein